MVSDLWQVYGIKLVDFVAGRIRGLTPRLLLSLIEGLPEGCNYHASVQGGPEFKGWTQDRYILAAIANNVNVGTSIHLKSAQAKKLFFIEPPKRAVSKEEPGGAFKKLAAVFSASKALDPENSPVTSMDEIRNAHLRQH